MEKENIILTIFAGILFLGGFGAIWKEAGFGVFLGVLTVIWANNIIRDLKK